MARRKRRSRRLVAWGVVLIAALLAVRYFPHIAHHRHHRHGIVDVPFYSNRPDLSELAPGAAGAIVRALGPRGLDRITQIISPGGRASLVSGGTHMPSGIYHGHLYGLAFDIAITRPDIAGSDTRRLRMQGIAAWYRSPDSPDGAAGSGPHIHCVWPGAPTHNPQNLEQIASFIHGYRALADAGRPRCDWIDPTITPAEIARVTHAYRTIHPRPLLSALRPYDALHRGRSETLASASVSGRSAG